MVLLSFLEPGAIDDIMAGEIWGEEISDGFLSFLALLWIVPLTMAFLAMTLKDGVNRWVNGIVGVVVAIFGVVDKVQELSKGEVSPAYYLVGVMMFVAAVLIVWYAWRWPKAGESQGVKGH